MTDFGQFDDFAASRREAWLAELVEFARQPSVSATGEGIAEMGPRVVARLRAAGATADVTATYKVSDGIADSNGATLTFTLTGTNDAPVAQSETVTATEGGGMVTGSVVATDVDDGASLTFSLHGEALHEA